MTVQELINHLQQFDSETKVMFSYTDPTDWTTKLYMNKNDVKLGNVLADDYDEDEELFDDYNNYIGPKVVLFELEY